jgi:hypothetical protein
MCGGGLSAGSELPGGDGVCPVPTRAVVGGHLWCGGHLRGDVVRPRTRLAEVPTVGVLVVASAPEAT